MVKFTIVLTYIYPCIVYSSHLLLPVVESYEIVIIALCTFIAVIIIAVLIFFVYKRFVR